VQAWTPHLVAIATRKLEISTSQRELATEPASNAIAYFMISVGLVIRLVVAGTTYLNPDEAYHYILGRAGSLYLAYQANLSNTHPPLLILLTYSFRWFANSEIMLRLPSVLAGTLSCWLTYKWLRLVTTPRIALAGLVLLLFLPPLFVLESELRQYSLLLLFISSALYWFEIAVQENSSAKMLLFSLALWLALATHFGALLFAVSMGMYALLRFIELRSGLRVVLPWTFGQAMLAAMAIFFYKNHLSLIQRPIQEMNDTWLRKALFHRGDTVITFLLVSTYRFFHFLFGQPVVGTAMLLLFVIGLVSMMRTEQQGLRFRRPAWMVAFALALSWLLALAGKYPFGGTRHSVMLLPFIVLAVGTGLAYVLRDHTRATPLVAILGATVCSLFPVPAGPHFTPPNQNIAFMRTAVDYVERTAGPNQLVLVDQQSAFVFRYYFCRNDVFSLQNVQNFTCERKRVHTSGTEWNLSGERLETDLRETRAAFEAGTSDSVFLFQSGWTVKGDPNLTKRLAQAGCQPENRFGRNIVACELK
jgi:uncharacterized membrane protein